VVRRVYSYFLICTVYRIYENTNVWCTYKQKKATSFKEAAFLS